VHEVRFTLEIQPTSYGPEEVAFTFERVNFVNSAMDCVTVRVPAN